MMGWRCVRSQVRGDRREGLRGRERRSSAGIKGTPTHTMNASRGVKSSRIVKCCVDFRRCKSSMGFSLSGKYRVYLNDAEISREVAEWDGALLPLLANEESRRDETSVSRRMETQPNNNPKERYRTVVQRGVAEGERGRGGKKMAGESRARAGRSFFGKSTLWPSSFFFLVVFFGSFFPIDYYY
jgi:hypothetical protein